MPAEFTDEAKAVLDAFARRNGRFWKQRLQHCWEQGDYHRFGMSIDQAAALQRIRNDPGRTPSLLKNYRANVAKETGK